MCLRLSADAGCFGGRCNSRRLRECFMVFERNWLGGKEQTGRAARISSLCAAGLRWATVSGTGIALSLGLVASMASAYLAGSTLASSRNFMPQKPLNLTTGRTVQSGKADRPVNVTRSVPPVEARSEEHTSELQSRENLVCRLLLEKKK